MVARAGAARRRGHRADPDAHEHPGGEHAEVPAVVLVAGGPGNAAAGPGGATRATGAPNTPRPQRGCTGAARAARQAVALVRVERGAARVRRSGHSCGPFPFPFVDGSASVGPRPAGDQQNVAPREWGAPHEVQAPAAPARPVAQPVDLAELGVDLLELGRAAGSTSSR